MATTDKYLNLKGLAQLWASMTSYVTKYVGKLTGSTQSAPAYDATKTYEVGKLVIYEDILYKCTTAVTEAEEFDEAKWTATTIADELGQETEASAKKIEQIIPTYDKESVYPEHTLVFYNDKVYKNSEAIAESEAFDETVWEETTLADEITSLPPYELQTEDGEYKSFNTTADAIVNANDMAYSAYKRTGNQTDEYDTTASYAVNDYCIFGDTLYKCTKVTSGEWDSSCWESTKIADELNSLNANLVNVACQTGVYSVIGTQTATTAAWTGNIDAAALYDGMTIAYYLPRPSGNNVTLTLTLSDGTETDAVAVYVTSQTRMSGQYNAGSTIILTYYAAGSILINGTATTEARWSGSDYYIANTETRLAYVCRIEAAETLAARRLIVANADGKYIQLAPGVAYDITHPILWSSMTRSAGAQFYDFIFDVTYDININNQGGTYTPETYSAVYIQGTLDGVMFTPTAALYAAAPTAEDGYVYMYLGTTSQIANYTRLSPTHAMYKYTDGAFRPYQY